MLVASDKNRKNIPFFVSKLKIGEILPIGNL